MIKHVILLNKLNPTGLSDNIIGCFKSCLTERRFTTEIGKGVL